MHDPVGSTLILRVFSAPESGARIRVMAVGGSEREQTLGIVTTPAAAAALVRGWLEAEIERLGQRPMGPRHRRSGPTTG